jgi:hypothetical protein
MNIGSIEGWKREAALAWDLSDVIDVHSLEDKAEKLARLAEIASQRRGSGD